MRRCLSLLGLILVLAPAGDLFGQLGGLRRRAQEAVRPQPQQAAAQQAVVVPLTSDVVTNYLKGLEARRQAMRTLARENSAIGQYFAAVLKRDSLQYRQNEYRAETGPDFEKSRQIHAAMQRGETNAYQDLDRLQRSIDPDQVDIPSADWSAQRQGNGRLDSAAMIGSGFSAAEWAYVGDLVPRVVGLMAHNGAVDDSMTVSIGRSVNIKPEEVVIVRASRVELSRALLIGYRTEAQIAAQKENARQEERAEEANADANTYNGCLANEMKPIQEEAERRRAELETAQKNNDTAKLMEFANRVMVVQTAAAQKCAPLLNQ